MAINRTSTPRTLRPGEVNSSYPSRQAAYRYIRATDRLPRYNQIPQDARFDAITCKVKLFNPTGIGTWWIAAYDPDTEIAWGVAELHVREVGSFAMTELVAFRGRFRLPIERDLHYAHKTVADILTDET